MAGITPVRSNGVSFSAISTGRSNSDNSHAYIASRINDLYVQALSRQKTMATDTRTLRRFIDGNSTEGKKLHKIV